MRSTTIVSSIRNRVLTGTSVVTGILFLIVCLTWGTTWLGIKIAVETIPPFTAAGARFLVAFPLFLVFAKLMNEPVLFPRDKTIFFVFITLAYFSLPYYLISYGEQFVSSGLTSLIFSAMPVFILIFSFIILKEPMLMRQVAGIAVGFASLLMILHGEGITVSATAFSGVIAILFAAILHGFCYVLTRKLGSDISVITFNTLPIGVAGFLLFGTGCWLESPNYTDVSNMSLMATLYLGLIASVGGFIVYFYLLKKMNPVTLSFVFILFPVIAIIVGAAYEKQTLSENFMIFAATMLAGFAITKMPERSSDS
ncbi:DMT family transporter [Parendozoicomonas sp. Alg238-R29]|uniref:DMT family transporter n=1 Tax=Parendozoicomonas sp. Alg238-R29 TaxID=2993446 RepID=UPI00248D5822|nr:DMT family transporter [Parendozoicomonas sp. Alg238-R29]